MAERSVEPTPAQGATPTPEGNDTARPREGLPDGTVATTEVARLREEAKKKRLKYKSAKAERDAALAELATLRAEREQAEQKKLEQQGEYQRLYEESQQRIAQLERAQTAATINLHARAEMARAGIADPDLQEFLLPSVLKKAAPQVTEKGVKGDFKDAIAFASKLLPTPEKADPEPAPRAPQHPAVSLMQAQLPSQDRQMPARRGDSVQQLAQKIRAARQ